MLDDAPAAVQSVVASIITALSLATTTAVVNLDTALDSSNTRGDVLRRSDGPVAALR